MPSLTVGQAVQVFVHTPETPNAGWVHGTYMGTDASGNIMVRVADGANARIYVANMAAYRQEWMLDTDEALTSPQTV